MDFTYEEATKNNCLETYEWDNIWWDHPQAEGPRGILIGDSISCGYRRMVNACLNETIFADGFGTSKSLDNPYFMTGLRYTASQQSRCDLVHFNNGLHGWHLSEQDYETAYWKLLREIQELYQDAPVIIALTTPLRDPKELNQFAPRNKIVQKRNEIAKRIAESMGFLVNDLYTLLADRPDLFLEDGVHLSQKGYQLLAEQIADMIRSVLQ